MGRPYPAGFLFKPTELELAKYYLLPRLQGLPLPPVDAVVEADVYASHPATLTSMYKDLDTGAGSWYFLSPRARKYKNGAQPSRSTDDGLGRWKMSTAKVSRGRVGSGIAYSGCTLAYFERKAKVERKTKWLMQEVSIPQYENKIAQTGSDKSASSKTLDEFVMCRIYVSRRHTEEHRQKEAGSSEHTELGFPQSELVAQADGLAQPSPESRAKSGWVETPCPAAAEPTRQQAAVSSMQSASRVPLQRPLRNDRAGQPKAAPIGQSSVQPCFTNQQRRLAAPNSVPGAALSGQALRQLGSSQAAPGHLNQKAAGSGGNARPADIQQQGLPFCNHGQARQISTIAETAQPPAAMMQQQQWMQAPAGYFLGDQNALVEGENASAGVICSSCARHQQMCGYGPPPLAGYPADPDFSAPVPCIVPAEESSVEGMMMPPPTSLPDVRAEGRDSAGSNYNDMQEFEDLATAPFSPDLQIFLEEFLG